MGTVFVAEWSKPAAFLLAGITFAILVTGILSLTVRRLHDLGLSGWWIIMITIVYLGAHTLASEQYVQNYAGVALIAMVANIIVYITLGFCRGTRGENKFGPDPLNIAGELK